MISLPPKVFHAIEAVLFIALNGMNGPVSSKDIAARQGVPPRYLEQLMQKLVRAGILRGMRGPRGGYLLARERRRITLADLCEALHEEEEYTLATPLARDVIAPAWTRAADVMREALGQVTLAELAAQAGAPKGAKKADFII